MRAALIATGVAVVAACGIEPDVGARLPGNCDNTASAAATVSFASDIRPLINRSPGGCGCHLPSSSGPSTGTQLSGLDLSSYATLREGGHTSGSQIVVAGQPCQSIMYLKLSESPPFGARMPLNGPPFWTPDELRLLHDWIAQGANEN